jgi:hypothetical protein
MLLSAPHNKGVSGKSLDFIYVRGCSILLEHSIARHTTGATTNVRHEHALFLLSG